MKTLMTILILGLSWIVLIPGYAHAVDHPSEGQGPTQVFIRFFLVDVDNVDTAQQSFQANFYLQLRWFDARLAHSGKKNISRSLDEVWNPRVQIVNQQKTWITFPDTVEIRPDGEVIYRQRVWGDFSQPLQLKMFPFDRQVFQISLAAVGYNPSEVEFKPDEHLKSGIAKKFSVAEWEILGWHTDFNPISLAPGMREVTGFTLSLEAKRQQGYYIVKVFIPLILILAMSWVVFWIDPKESGIQISIAITTMLTLIAYRFAVDNSIPKVSYLTQLDYFILVSTVLVYLVLIQVIITSTLAAKGKYDVAKRLDWWARFVFPAIFVVISIDIFFHGLF